MTKRTSRKGLGNRMMQTGPYLASAAIVEKVLQEDDNRVPSLIRIVDRLALPAGAEPPKGDLTTIAGLFAFFAIKAGSFYGDCQMSIYHISPNGKVMNEPIADNYAIEFPKNPIAGFNIHMPVTLKWDGPGLYTYEMRLDGVPFARVSFNVFVGKLPPLSQDERAKIKDRNHGSK